MKLIRIYYFIPLMLCVMYMSSCKFEAKDKKCFITKITEGKDSHVTYQYENNFIKRTEVYRKDRIYRYQHYLYDEKGNIIKSFLGNGKGDTLSYFIYSYNTDGLMDTIYKFNVLYNNNIRKDEGSGYSVRKYNSMGQLIQISKLNIGIKGGKVIEVEFQHNFEYNDEGNINIMTTNRVYKGEVTVMDNIEYSYDESMNAYTSLIHIDMEPFIVPFYLSRNNVKKWTRKYPDGRTLFSESFEYDEYNSNNYPVKFRKIGFVGGTKEQHIEYQCED